MSKFTKAQLGKVNILEIVTGIFASAPVTGTANTKKARYLQRLTVLSFSWWAQLGSNQRPLECESSDLPLIYAPIFHILLNFFNFRWWS
jgi:hypothetical protein